MKNAPFALDPLATPGDLREDPPYAFSSDLSGAFTNAFYTTINRDPFEWSYDADPDPLVQDFVGSPVPDDALGTLVSGPRWRLKPNKFGQDLPGLEIPLIECSPPPFQSDNIKYQVGVPTTTIINLLDWERRKWTTGYQQGLGRCHCQRVCYSGGNRPGQWYFIYHQWPADDG